MSQGISDYYDGSRLLTGLADYFDMSVDQVNFVVSQIFGLISAYILRIFLHPSKANASIRQGYGLSLALFIGYFCFGKQAIHLAGLPILSYIVIRTQRPEIIQRVVLIISLLYLSLVHLHRQIYDYGSYGLDITGPLMVITQKVTSLAFNIHDGLTGNEDELQSTQKLYIVKKLPSALEFFSYCLYFPCLMAGPLIFYKEYKDFINGENFTVPSSNNVDSAESTIVKEPSPTPAVYKKVCLGLIYALIFVKLFPLFPIKRIKDDNFVENTSLMYKFWYLSVSTTLVRFKYYFAWTLADAVCNNAGLGFNGFYSDGSSRWDKFSNVDFIGFEFGKSLKESIEAWNVGTNRWLRMMVYERVKNYPTVLTYALSALWHGFYPGYYVTFANGALFTFAARTVRRTIRNYFILNTETKVLYDILTFAVTRLVMAYITYTFVLLEFWPGIRLYNHMYWCLHVLALMAMFVLPKVISRADPNCKSSKHSITQVLNQARPITNNLTTRHHD